MFVTYVMLGSTAKTARTNAMLVTRAVRKRRLRDFVGLLGFEPRTARL